VPLPRAAAEQPHGARAPMAAPSSGAPETGEPAVGDGATEAHAEQATEAHAEQTVDDAAALDVDEARARWPGVLRWLQEQNKGNIKGYLSATTEQGLQVEGAALVIGFPASSKLMRERLEQPMNRAVLEQAVCAVYGSQWRVRCATIDGLAAPPSADEFEEYADELGRAYRARRAER
jgi:hypothetical protein